MIERASRETYKASDCDSQQTWSSLKLNYFTLLFEFCQASLGVYYANETICAVDLHFKHFNVYHSPPQAMLLKVKIFRPLSFNDNFIKRKKFISYYFPGLLLSHSCSRTLVKRDRM